MGRLTNLKPALRSLPPSISTATDRDEHGHSSAAEPWRKWYSWARWKRLRLQVLLRDAYTCQMPGCGRLEPDTSQLVADHVKAHRGDPELFWDEANVQTLCAPCHNRVKQAEEAAERRGPGAARKLGVRGVSRPVRFRKVYVPLTIVCGPPGAGKSTYVRQHASSSELVVCFDEIATRMFGQPAEVRTQASLGSDEIGAVLRVRNEMLADLMHAKARARWSGAWLVLTEPSGRHRQWWATTTGAQVIVLATSERECARRIASDAVAGDVRGEGSLTFVKRWWSIYRPAPCDRVVTG